MPESLRPGHRRGLTAALLAVAVIATACGGSSVETAATDADTPTAPPASSGGTGAGVDQEGVDQAPEDQAGADQADTDQAGADRAVEAEETAENLFPDVDVLNVVDGSTVNLASELGGGELPVLLWFWAPH